jgi:PKD repeat protein
VIQSGSRVAAIGRLVTASATGVVLTGLVAVGLWVSDDDGRKRPDEAGQGAVDPDTGSTDRGAGADAARDIGGDIGGDVGYPDGVADGSPGAPSVLGIEEEPDRQEVDVEVVADLSSSTSEVLVGHRVVFVDASSGDPTSRTWDFGDGTTDSAAEVVKSWSRAGTYLVTLTVADAVSTDSTSVTITVLDDVEVPNAVIVISDDNVETGELVRLRSESTGGSLDILWDFGDGRGGTAVDVTHSYELPGSYVVTLIVSNPAGSSTSTVVVTVTASIAPPVALIDLPPGIVEAGVATTLESVSLNEPEVLEWVFGDGSTGSGTPVSHTWLTEGIYEVTLVATNGAGSSTSSAIVTVLGYLPPPVASFDAPATASVGSEVRFVDTSSDATDWTWDFGDGGSAATATPGHTYSTTGTFDVSLTVTNRNGSDTSTATIEVVVPPPPPVAQFTPSAEAVGTGETVTFTNTSTGTVSYSWDFGDGNTSTEASPAHVFTSPGAHTVELTAINSVGETDTAEVKIRVNRGS